MQQPDYVHTDTLDDAISSFELADLFFTKAREDDRFWKWFVVACHSGVQGTFALALQKSDGLLVQKPGVAREMLAAFEVRAVPPPPHMDNFLRLHRKLHEHGVLKAQDTLPSFAQQETDLRALDDLRDEFLHFNTKAWSVEKALIERRVRLGLRISRFLLLESGAVRIYDELDLDRAREAILALCSRLRVDA